MKRQICLTLAFLTLFQAVALAQTSPEPTRLTSQLTWKAMDGISFARQPKDPNKEPEFNQLFGLWVYAAAGKEIPADIIQDLIKRANVPKLKFSVMNADGYRWEMRHMILAEYDQSRMLADLTDTAKTQEAKLQEQDILIKTLQAHIATLERKNIDLETRVSKIQEENAEFKTGLALLLKKIGG